jgi:vacuolar-type H+-ATPase subunit H
MKDFQRDLWSDFDTFCKNAEIKRDRVIRAAEEERDQIITAMRWKARERVKSLAEAICSAAIDAANTACENSCKAAAQTVWNEIETNPEGKVVADARRS